MPRPRKAPSVTAAPLEPPYRYEVAAELAGGYYAVRVFRRGEPTCCWGGTYPTREEAERAALAKIAEKERR